jgi:prolyl 4-hydroxylase
MVLSYCKINHDFPQLTVACSEPPIYLVPGFLTLDECDAIVSETMARMPTTASAVEPEGVSGVHAWSAADSGASRATPRTSSSVDSSDEWCHNIHDLVSILTQQSTEHMERPTVTRYLAGQEYVPHHDAFPPGDPLAGPSFGGNRICTVLVYLNDVAAGGHTVFHEARNQAGALSFKPQAGTAVLFFPSDCESGDFDPLAVHSAEQAVDEKWVTQTWVRQGSPGNMTTMAGRKAESAAAAVTAAATEIADTRPPEPAALSGQGNWRYFPG